MNIFKAYIITKNEQARLRAQIRVDYRRYPHIMRMKLRNIDQYLYDK